LFGRIALEKGLVTESQLSRAVRYQEEIRSLGLEKPLGEILVSEGILKPQDVLLILRLQKVNETKRESKRFVRLAFANGLLTKEQGESAIDVVRFEGYQRSVAAVLVERGDLTQGQVRAVRAAIERKDEKLKQKEREKEKERERERDKEREKDEKNEKNEKEIESGSFATRQTGKLGDAHALDVDPAFLPPDLAKRTRDLLFASIALRDGLVLVPELERALQHQLTLPDEPPLEQILLERGILTEKEVSAISQALTASRAEKLTIPGYRISDVLGRGSTALVLRARHEIIDREVAIKLFKTEHMETADAEALVEEARTYAKINHPNVVGLYEVGRVHRRIYYVMELVEGRTLYEMIRRRGMIPEKETLAYAREVVRALEAFREAGLVHRDVKPQNIMITRDGVAKLTDLGLAKEVDRPDANPDAIYGTPHTIAPEQATGGKLDIRTDLYGLGATIYYALTGGPPYSGSDPLAIVMHHLTKAVPDPRVKCPDVSEGTARFVQALLAKDAKDRPAGPKEALATIEKLLRDLQEPPWPTVPASDLEI